MICSLSSRLRLLCAEKSLQLKSCLFAVQTIWFRFEFIFLAGKNNVQEENVIVNTIINSITKRRSCHHVIPLRWKKLKKMIIPKSPPRPKAAIYPTPQNSIHPLATATLKLTKKCPILCLSLFKKRKFLPWHLISQ